MAKDKKPEITSEHVFTIPLRSEWSKARRIMRTKRSVSSVRLFIIKNTRAKSVKISTKLNETLWTGGAKNPPSKIRVKASVDSEGLASVKLPEEITLEEEKKKFLGKKKSKGKSGTEKEEVKGESPEKKGEEKIEAAEEPSKETEAAPGEKNDEQKNEAGKDAEPEEKK